MIATETRPYLLHILFLIFTLLPAALFAQNACGMHPPEFPAAFSKTASSPREIASRPGAHLPTAGTVRGLVLFVQSKNDDIQDAAWQNGTFPTWTGRMMSELHDYYLAMSNGKLDLQLDVYPDYIISGKTENEYVDQGVFYGSFIKEVLGEIDQKMDFGEYDNWQMTGRIFRPVEGPDGTVDLLIVFHRSIRNRSWMPYAGVSDLMFGGTYYVDDYRHNVYGGTGYNTDAGASGLVITGTAWYDYVLDYDKAFRIALHEMQHKLFTDVHATDSFAGLGVISGNASGIAMCAIERHFMDYLTIPLLEYNADTVITLRDYVLTGDAVSIPIEENDRFYYVVEYRTKQHPYDTAPEKGVFIYRVDDNWSLMDKKIVVVTADGQWAWKVHESTGAIEHDYPDAIAGFNPLQKIVIDGKPYWHKDYAGYEGIAFTPQRSPMGMYRNPSPDFILKGDTVHTPLTVAVLSMDEDEAKISITHTPPEVLGSETLSEHSFALGAGYPNPVSAGADGIVTIPYALTRAGTVSLAVYDALGRAVYESGPRAAGPGRQIFSVSVARFAPGSYTYRLLTPEGAAHKRLIISN